MLRRFILAACLVLLAPVLARAQTPQLMDSALADLSQRVGRTVTLNDLTNWTFAQSSYPDTSLGCPQPGITYAQVITPGVQFMLTYAGNIYDYRVSGDRTAIILCSVTPAPPTPASENCPPAGDAAYLPPRLRVGGQARVTEGGIPNLMRSGPGQSGSVVGEIPPGGQFAVLDGPRCSTLDKLIWWQVNYNGVAGWTAEGQAGEYWLEPLGAGGVLTTATPAPALSRRILAENAAQVGHISSLGGLTGVAAFSPDTQLVLLGQADHSIAIFDGSTGQPAAVITGVHSAPVTAITFGAKGQLVATADQSGLIVIWDIGRAGTFGQRPHSVTWNSAENGAIAERIRLGGVTGAVYALAFSPDGLLLAGGGEDQAIRLWSTGGAGEGLVMPLVIFPAQAAAITQLMFSSDGTRLVSAAADGSASVWGLPQ